MLAQKLRAAGANVYITRQDDTFISLQARVSTSHYRNADAFISIHYDSYADTSTREARLIITVRLRIASLPQTSILK